MELRAYLNESANIEWKDRLEDEGIKVFVGIPQMKVHAKICVIKRRVEGKEEHYGFIGTGNLNEKTSLSYTDHFLLTSNPAIMADLNRIFKALENPSSNWDQLGLCKCLLVAPLNMREELLKMIKDEIKYAKAGKPSRIIIDINSFTDEKLFRKLFKAHEAGVEVKLIVRSVFCPVNGYQKFMHATSIVDEYLEHSRIASFIMAAMKRSIFLLPIGWFEIWIIALKLQLRFWTTR